MPLTVTSEECRRVVEYCKAKGWVSVRPAEKLTGHPVKAQKWSIDNRVREALLTGEMSGCPECGRIIETYNRGDGKRYTSHRKFMRGPHCRYGDQLVGI